MRTTIALLIAAAALGACGEDQPGPAAKAFNAERKAVDDRDAAALRTRMVKPPRMANGGYEALPSAIDPDGQRPSPESSPTPDASLASGARSRGAGYLLVPGSAEPPPTDPAAEAALRRPDPRRRAEIAASVARAEARRKAVIAAQTKAIGGGREKRREALKRADAEILKAYRPPTAVKVAPAKGGAPSTARPAPRPTGTATAR